MKKKTTVSIEFDNAKIAKHFMSWLCEAGEQDYFQWMEYREREQARRNDSGNITAVVFDYDFKNRKITTETGRLIKNE